MNLLQSCFNVKEGFGFYSPEYKEIMRQVESHYEKCIMEDKNKDIENFYTEVVEFYNNKLIHLLVTSNYSKKSIMKLKKVLKVFNKKFTINTIKKRLTNKNYAKVSFPVCGSFSSHITEFFEKKSIEFNKKLGLVIGKFDFEKGNYIKNEVKPDLIDKGLIPEIEVFHCIRRLDAHRYALCEEERVLKEFGCFEEALIMLDALSPITASSSFGKDERQLTWEIETCESYDLNSPCHIDVYNIETHNVMPETYVKNGELIGNFYYSNRYKDL